MVIKTLLPLGLLPIFVLLTACEMEFFSQKSDSSPDASVTSASAETLNVAEGTMTARIVDASIAQTITADPDSGEDLANASVTFEPGSLAVGTEVTLETAVSIATTTLMTDLGISGETTVAAAGSAIAITSSSSEASSIPFALALAIPPEVSLGLAEGDNSKIVVFFKVMIAGAREFKAGIFLPSNIRVESGLAHILADSFGVYQVVRLSESLLVEQVQPIVVEAPILTKAVENSMPVVEWKVTARSNTDRTAVFTFEIDGLDTLDRCSAILDDDKREPWKAVKALDNSGTYVADAFATSAHTIYAQFNCQDIQGRDSGNSAWASVSLPAADSIAPTVTLAATVPAYTNINSHPMTVHFSENVEGLELADFVPVGSMTVTKLVKVTAKQYKVDLMTSGNGAMQVSLPAGAVKDLAGNNSLASNAVVFHFDNIAPQASLSISGSDPTNSALVTLNISASDSTQMYLTNTAGCATGGIYEALAATKAWTLGQSNSLAVVYMKTKDAAGNESPCVSDSVTHDNSPPALTFSAASPSSPSSNPAPQILGTSSADAVGISLYSDSVCTNQIGSGSAAAYASSGIAVSVNANTSTSIYGKAADAAGNVSNCQYLTLYSHQIDSPPNINLLEPAGKDDAITTNEFFTISFAATDSGGAVAVVSLYYKNSALACDPSLAGWTPIVNGLTESDTSYNWDTDGVAPGHYFVCAKIDDGNHAPVFAVSPSYLRIQLAQFITTWITTNPGSSDNLTIALPLVNGGSYNFTVNWGDTNVDTVDAYNSASATHTYAQAGTYTVTIEGQIKGWKFNNGGDAAKLTNISQWGPFEFGASGSTFFGATNLTVTAADTPNLMAPTNLSSTFRLCTSMATVPGMNAWDMSSVTTMSSMFYGATAFNEAIGDWDTSGVTNMSGMFYNASAFNQPLNNWQTANVTSMSNMFQNAGGFNGLIDSWDTSAVTTMANMFSGAGAFNQPIGSWQTANVTSMSNMFLNAGAFNQAINSWDTSQVSTMAGMFSGASSFNQPLDNWATSSVTLMISMFMNAGAFDQDISGWNVSNVMNMNSMFKYATSFNQNIVNWNISSVQYMDYMFYGATNFTQAYVSGWDLGNISPSPTDMFGP